MCIKESPVENQQVFVQLVNIYKQKVGTDKWNKFINDPFFLPGAVNKINALLSQWYRIKYLKYLSVWSIQIDNIIN